MASFVNGVINVCISVDVENYGHTAVTLIYMMLEVACWYGLYKLKLEKSVDVIEKSCK